MVKGAAALVERPADEKAVSSRRAARCIIAFVEQEERIEVNEQQTTYEREYVARVEVGLQKIFGSILALMDKIAELSVEIHSKRCGSKTDLNEHAKIRKEKFDSHETAVRRIRRRGPETEVPNVVVDATKSVHDFIEIKQHASTTFKLHRSKNRLSKWLR